MTLHSWVVWAPLPLLLLLLALDILAVRASGDAGESGGRNRKGRSRPVVGLFIVAACLAAFTGLGARRTLPAAVPGATMPWDVHVTWAVVLLLPVLVLSLVRLGFAGPSWIVPSRRLLLLDLALFLLVAVILVTGLQVP